MISITSLPKHRIKGRKVVHWIIGGIAVAGLVTLAQHSTSTVSLESASRPSAAVVAPTTTTTTTTDDASTEDTAADASMDAGAAEYVKQVADEFATKVQFSSGDLSISDMCEPAFITATMPGDRRWPPILKSDHDAFIVECSRVLFDRGASATESQDPEAVYGNPYEVQTPDPEGGIAVGTPDGGDRSRYSEPGTAVGSAPGDRAGMSEPGTAVGKPTGDRSGEQEPGTAVGPTSAPTSEPTAEPSTDSTDSSSESPDTVG